MNNSTKKRFKEHITKYTNNFKIYVFDIKTNDMYYQGSIAQLMTGYYGKAKLEELKDFVINSMVKLPDGILEDDFIVYIGVYWDKEEPPYVGWTPYQEI